MISAAVMRRMRRNGLGKSTAPRMEDDDGSHRSIFFFFFG
jgi:hypothetical protein